MPWDAPTHLYPVWASACGAPEAPPGAMGGAPVDDRSGSRQARAPLCRQEAGLGGLRTQGPWFCDSPFWGGFHQMGLILRGERGQGAWAGGWGGTGGPCGTEKPSGCQGARGAACSGPAGTGAQAHVGEAPPPGTNASQGPPSCLLPQLQETHRKDPQSKTCGSRHVNRWGSPATFLCHGRKRGRAAETRGPHPTPAGAQAPCAAPIAASVHPHPTLTCGSGWRWPQGTGCRDITAPTGSAPAAPTAPLG